MRPRSIRLLALLLALLVGVGPVGAVSSNRHLCTPSQTRVDADSMHSVHADHREHVAPGVPLTAGDVQGACADCPGDCCAGGGCAMNTCGGGAAALFPGPASAPVDGLALPYEAVSRQPLPQFPFIPLRPPRV